MTGRDGFLQRWSRRKVEAERNTRTEPAPAPGDPEIRPAIEPEAGAPAAALVLTEDELAALPRIEDLTAETDLVQFMRAGIPPLLRNAALRQVWSLDPAIRDFVGEARDYSWDWNVSGGVPVSGPLLPGDDVEAVLKGMFTRGPDEIDDETPAASGTARDEPLAADAAPPLPDRGEPGSEALATGDATPVVPVTEAPVSEPSHPIPGEPADIPVSGEPARRRHGAAIPKLDSF